MTWNTARGPRTLSGAEANLIGQSAWQLTDSIREVVSIDSGLCFGIVLFDAMTWQQQVVMLDKVLAPLLDPDIAAPKSTALMDATIAAVYAQMERFVQCEIDLDRNSDWDEDDYGDQRQRIYNALVESRYEGKKPGVDCGDMEAWELVILCLKDRVLADEDYQMDSMALDLPPEQSTVLKQAMGISGDYFIDVPPDATTEDAQNAWANIVQRVSGERRTRSASPRVCSTSHRCHGTRFILRFGFLRSAPDRNCRTVKNFV